jgi:hypothetical protein
MWQDIGAGAISGAGAGATLGPWGALGGAVVGGVGGAISGSEKERRNAEAKKYADTEVGNSRQQTLMALEEKKRKYQWQLQFQNAMRSALLSGAGQGA